MTHDQPLEDVILVSTDADDTLHYMDWIADVVFICMAPGDACVSEKLPSWPDWLNLTLNKNTMFKHLFTINLIKYTFYLPSCRDLKIDNYYVNTFK